MSGPAPAGSPLIPDELDATLVLIRHAQSTFVAEGRFQGRLDPPLSSLGREQAQRAAAWLARPGGPPGLRLPGLPREVVHSPLLRVSQTAQPIAEALGESFAVPWSGLVRPEPRLVEIGVGAWEGLTNDQVVARWGPLLAAWRQDAYTTIPPGGESLLAAAARVRGAIPEAFAALAAPGPDPAHTPDPPWSIVVAHGGILRLLLFALLDLPLTRFWVFPFALASLTVVDVRGGRASLRAHNLGQHLTGVEGGGDLRVL